MQHSPQEISAKAKDFDKCQHFSSTIQNCTKFARLNGKCDNEEDNKRYANVVKFQVLTV